MVPADAPARPSAPEDPEIVLNPSSETTQEANRLNQAMESNIRERTNTINQAVNFNQLMGFDTEELTQDLLEEYLSKQDFLSQNSLRKLDGRMSLTKRGETVKWLRASIHTV